MEPVPETESLEKFRPSPLPTPRLQSLAAHSDPEPNRKPPTVRRSTEPPSPILPSWSSPSAFSLPYRPRTTSPLSATHTKSKSTTCLALPPMSRTRSMPGLDGTGRVLSLPLLRPDSPGSSSRTRQRRKPADEVFPPTSPMRSSVFDADKRAPDRSVSPSLSISSSNSGGHHRRTSSPFQHTVPPSSSATFTLPSSPSSIATSPTYKYDAGTPSSSSFLSCYPSSSMPSTPTSLRSRSPSISSLETIPDSPDAEEAALEADRVAKLRAVAENSDGEDSTGEAKSRSSLDVPSRGRTPGMGARDKRKRWSVCGAERRGDLDLETIWED